MHLQQRAAEQACSARATSRCSSTMQAPRPPRPGLDQRPARHHAAPQRCGRQLDHRQERRDADVPRRCRRLAGDHAPTCRSTRRTSRGASMSRSARARSSSAVSTSLPLPAARPCRLLLLPAAAAGGSGRRAASAPVQARRAAVAEAAARGAEPPVRRGAQQHVARPVHVRRRAQAGGVATRAMRACTTCPPSSPQPVRRSSHIMRSPSRDRSAREQSPEGYMRDLHELIAAEQAGHQGPRAQATGASSPSSISRCRAAAGSPRTRTSPSSGASRRASPTWRTTTC